jgi:putative DNA primase/helicase
MKRIEALETEMLSEPVEVTDDALALEFTRCHGDDLLYVHEWGRWLRWDEHRWAVERTLAVFDLARALAHTLGEGVAEAALKRRLLSAGTVAAIVALARADRAHARVTEDFDADPMLLNTPGGTVDLRTGLMRPSCRVDGITKVTPVMPSSAPATLWMDCLRTWTQYDDELISFLQRLCGYWLTGSVREEQFTMVYGPGRNGKTKFLEAIRACLGPDYVTGVAMETLIVTTGEQHPTDLADLRGKRLAIASETEQGRRLAEAKIKHITGGDQLRARHMRRDFFEFNPTHKLVIVGNHRPVIRNVDEAMRRRLVLIPFNAVIPPERQDPHLAQKLATEYPAILGWMLEGCRRWLERGLDPPSRVLAATEDYLSSADAIATWVGECCVFGPNAVLTKAKAFESWKAWAEASGEFVGNKRRLCERISTLPKVDEGRLGKNRDEAFLGIGLRPEPGP